MRERPKRWIHMATVYRVFQRVAEFQIFSNTSRMRLSAFVTSLRAERKDGTSAPSQIKRARIPGPIRPKPVQASWCTLRQGRSIAAGGSRMFKRLLVALALVSSAYGGYVFAQKNVGPLPAPPSAAPDVSFQLSLDREHGRAMFRRCRLNVVVSQKRGSSQLSCEYNVKPAVPPVAQGEELSPNETQDLIRLFGPAALYEGGHIGEATTTMIDAPFETLLASKQSRTGSRTVVLVTSGNATFETNPARKELL